MLRVTASSRSICHALPKKPFGARPTHRCRLASSFQLKDIQPSPPPESRNRLASQRPVSSDTSVATGAEPTRNQVGRRIQHDRSVAPEPSRNLSSRIYRPRHPPRSCIEMPRPACVTVPPGRFSSPIPPSRRASPPPQSATTGTSKTRCTTLVTYHFPEEDQSRIRRNPCLARLRSFAFTMCYAGPLRLTSVGATRRDQGSAHVRRLFGDDQTHQAAGARAGRVKVTGPPTGTPESDVVPR